MNFILKKEIDASLISEGFAIPVKAQPVLSIYLKGGALTHGEKRQIKILLNGEILDATLVSVNFNQNKNPNHSEMWQIHYKADIAKKFAEIFIRSREANFKLPIYAREYLTLYATDIKDMFYAVSARSVEGIDEMSLENLIERPILNNEETALIERLSLTKVRHLNREIIDDLKKLYDFQCQICGYSFKKLYGVEVAECHHIDYFVRSLNNNASNLLIVCPNHHRIIHAANPVFDRDKKIFRYDDGSCERLKLNRHL